MSDEYIGFKWISETLGTEVNSTQEIITHIKENFKPVQNYIMPHDPAFSMLGIPQVYGDQEKQLGAILISEHDHVKVIAIADFKEEVEIVTEIDPDGFGDRVSMQRLRDGRLTAIKQYLV